MSFPINSIIMTIKLTSLSSALTQPTRFRLVRFRSRFRFIIFSCALARGCDSRLVATGEVVIVSGSIINRSQWLKLTLMLREKEKEEKILKQLFFLMRSHWSQQLIAYTPSNCTHLSAISRASKEMMAIGDPKLTSIGSHPEVSSLLFSLPYKRLDWLI